ncbi:MAG: YicC/YloC family endoribonuclease [Candidatus Omnitrophota bacterium]
MQSMTGFGGKESEVAPFGKICVELRSTNHKSLETVIHLPEGLLSLEDRIKKQIEAKIKRGRVTCVVAIVGGKASGVFINKGLLRSYLSAIRSTKEEFHIRDDVSINTVIHLPGVLSLGEERISKENVWPRLKILVNQVLAELLNARKKEGKALAGYLSNKAQALRAELEMIRSRFKRAIREKMNSFNSDEERSSFLKSSDITEEMDRLSFHVRNLKHKLGKSGAIGKELDFIAQEMQREANTMGAKSFDVNISSRSVQMKSQIEKIREQAQNIE